jgi:uncharacterized protein YcfJ
MASNAATNSDHTSRSGHLLVDAAATLLGAAAGAKIADDLLGGNGLPSILAQLGGALLGGYGGKSLADFLGKQASER